MPPRKQKIAWPKQSGRKPSRPRNLTPAAESRNDQKLTLKLKLSPNAYKDSQSPLAVHNPLLTAPASADVPSKGTVEHDMQSDVDLQGRRRGARQRTKVYQPDMVFGSELESLVTASVAIGKVDDDDDNMNVDKIPRKCLISDLATTADTNSRRSELARAHGLQLARNHSCRIITAAIYWPDFRRCPQHSQYASVLDRGTSGFA